MKSLTDYTQAEVTACFEKHGVFFAFGQKQFNEKKKQDTEYVTVTGAGDCCPKENAKLFHEELTKIYADGEKAYLAEYGIEAIIKHELANHECYYTGDWHKAYLMTESYGATEAQVKNIYQQELVNNSDF